MSQRSAAWNFGRGEFRWCLGKCRHDVVGIVAAACLLVTSSEVCGQDIHTWRVADGPSVSYGSDDGPGSDLFGIVGAIWLTDGRAVVADRGQRLVAFSSDGRYVGTYGRSGQGPGEFGRVVRIALLGSDTLVVFDRGNYRISYFHVGEDLIFERSVSPGSTPPPVFQGVFEDGSLLMTSGTGRASSGPLPDAGIIPAGRLQLSQFDAHGRWIRDITTVDGGELLLFPNAPLVALRGLLRRPVFAVGNTHVYVSDGRRVEVAVFGVSGEVEGTIRGDYQPLPLTRARLGDRLSSGPFATREIPELPDEQTFPAIISLRVDDGGRLWVEEGREDIDGPGVWRVFDSSGSQVASVAVPARFTPYHIMTGMVLGVWKDDLDVEHLQARSISADNP